MVRPWRPSRDQIAAARGKTVPDVIAPRLHVLFCGINPSLYSGAVGHHFARPGNRFWRALHLSGFTPRELSPFEEAELTSLGLGITNLYARATAAAAEIPPEHLAPGAATLTRKVLRYEPRMLAVLGVGAYRSAFERPAATVGPQQEAIGATRIWVLPNPSGLNAHYQLDDLVRAFRELREKTIPGSQSPSARPARRA